MKTPKSVKSLEELGRVRLSKSFFMRDMLYSEIANFHGIPNVPHDPDLAIYTAKKLCQELLEPLQEQFGRISIRSAYRSPEVNKFGNDRSLSCASNESNYAGHIFDYRDSNGHCGATATVVVNRFADYFDQTKDWQAMAWWIHDNLPPTDLYFFPKLAAFNVSWHEQPTQTIKSYIAPKGTLTRPGMVNFEGAHATEYTQLFDWLNSKPS